MVEVRSVQALTALCDMPLQEKLPAAKQGGEPLPEGLMWLLLTGDVRCCIGRPNVLLTCSG